jgi:hypothetical protein
MRRLLTVGGLLTLTALAAPSSSYAQQSLNFYLGGFVPNGEDSRLQEGSFSDDVLVNNLDFLAFNISDFKGVTGGAEYLVGLGDFFDAGVGIGIYRRTVPSVYFDLVNENGSEIEQDLKLRIVPMTATVRVLPLGRSVPVQPYIGAGVGIYQWRYSETGDFVDPNDGTIFRGSFSGSGTATGPVILGGVRFPMDAWDIGGELRYQKASGELPIDEGFSADKIDLGGWTYAVTFNVHF